MMRNSIQNIVDYMIVTTCLSYWISKGYAAEVILGSIVIVILSLATNKKEPIS